ncbi:MAG: hypothetical protein AAF961_19555, partial [Planctomycetota bacterium]
PGIAAAMNPPGKTSRSFLSRISLFGSSNQANTWLGDKVRQPLASPTSLNILSYSKYERVTRSLDGRSIDT